MPGETRYLARHERLVLSVRRHWSVLVPSAAAAAAAIALAALVGVVSSPNQGGGLLDNAAGAVALFFVLRLAWRAWGWWLDRIVVTNHRIFEVSGILTRSVASMPLRKVTDMTYRRSLIGRLVGYGEIVLESAGQDQALGFIHHLPNPDAIYTRLTSMVTAPPTWDDDEGPVPRPRAFDEKDTGELPRVRA